MITHRAVRGEASATTERRRFDAPESAMALLGQGCSINKTSAIASHSAANGLLGSGRCARLYQ
jgi:hypothetical protein